MKVFFKYLLLAICFLSIISCSTQVFSNRFNLNKAYNLYEKGKNEDDDKALLEVTSIYNEGNRMSRKYKKKTPKLVF